MENEMKRFIAEEARPLPVILLLDISGSMDREMDSLNQAVSTMIKNFAEESSLMAEIHLGIITFGGEAKIHTDLIPARKIEWTPMDANGMTPLGGALKLAKKMIEDKEKISSRSYRPAVILLSDGAPNDEWESEMESFINDGRTKKCDRWALAIGDGADRVMLKKFLNDPEKKLFSANEANDIKKFFKLMTMTTTARTRSQTPNTVPNINDMIAIFKEEACNDEYDF